MKSKSIMTGGAAIILLIACSYFSLHFDLGKIHFSSYLRLLHDYDKTNAVDFMLASRLFRWLACLVAGTALAVCGALMQMLTRNFLASPTILGGSDGSVLFITVFFLFLPGLSNSQTILVSILGSVFGIFLVLTLTQLLSKANSLTGLPLIGIIASTLLNSIAVFLASYFQLSQSISFWYNARLSQLNPRAVFGMMIVSLIVLLLICCLAPKINILQLGDELATSLGLQTTIFRFLLYGFVCILTGLTVAVVGKIAFVGLVVPHLVRAFSARDYRFILPVSALFGAVLLVSSDLLSRYLNYPYETPVSLLLSLIGVPFFLTLIYRKERMYE